LGLIKLTGVKSGQIFQEAREVVNGTGKLVSKLGPVGNFLSVGLISYEVSVTLKETPETVYNIEVEGNHNYFVTNSNILVHNK